MIQVKNIIHSLSKQNRVKTRKRTVTKRYARTESIKIKRTLQQELDSHDESKYSNEFEASTQN